MTATRVRLGLAELVVAARSAGVPLPIRTDPAPSLTGRMAARLAGVSPSVAHDRVARELARAGSAAAGEPDPGVSAALQTLAGGPLSWVLDACVVRRAGEVRLRSWFGVGPGLAAQLSTGSPLEFELQWFDPREWVAQVARAVTVEPWAPEPAPLALPDYVSLPSELLAGCDKAHRDHRTDLLAPMATTHLGRIRMGEPGRVASAEAGQALALLQTLGGACRGRLRLLCRRRDRAASAGVAAWLLFDDGWHELRPGREATSVLRRRDARDLGLFTRPLVAELTEREVA